MATLAIKYFWQNKAIKNFDTYYICVKERKRERKSKIGRFIFVIVFPVSVVVSKEMKSKPYF